MESKQSILNQSISAAHAAHKGLQQHAQSPIEQVHAQSQRAVEKQQEQAAADISAQRRLRGQRS